eukprot:scaffold15128_cov99-Cyclotella_meneghiniana.AAC.2
MGQFSNTTKILKNLDFREEFELLPRYCYVVLCAIDKIVANAERKEVRSATGQVPLLYFVSGNDPDYLNKDGSVAAFLKESKQSFNDEQTRPRCVDFPEMKHGWPRA